VPAVIAVVAGLVCAVAARLPWFWVNFGAFHRSVNGLRSSSGSSGWLWGVPPGWVCILGGIGVAVLGVAVLARATREPARLAGIGSIVIGVLVFGVTLANRQHLHDYVDRALAGAPERFAVSLQLTDGTGLLLALAASLGMLLAGVWLLVATNRPARPAPGA
jgi:hypothetical protein